MRARSLTVGIAATAVVVVLGGGYVAAAPLISSGDPTADSRTEVPPPSPSAGGLPGVPQGSAQYPPLVTLPLPAAVTKATGLAAAHPAALAPAPDSTVTSSSLAPAVGDALQVTLAATSTRSAEAVLGAYRVRLAAIGFREVTGKAVGGSLAASFRRNDNAVVVTATNGAKATTYTVFATVFPKG
jgi:hypothetical protein